MYVYYIMVKPTRKRSLKNRRKTKKTRRCKNKSRCKGAVNNNIYGGDTLNDLTFFLDKRLLKKEYNTTKYNEYEPNYDNYNDEDINKIYKLRDGESFASDDFHYEYINELENERITGDVAKQLNELLNKIYEYFKKKEELKEKLTFFLEKKLFDINMNTPKYNDYKTNDINRINELYNRYFNNNKNEYINKLMEYKLVDDPSKTSQLLIDIYQHFKKERDKTTNELDYILNKNNKFEFTDDELNIFYNLLNFDKNYYIRIGFNENYLDYIMTKLNNIYKRITLIGVFEKYYNTHKVDETDKSDIYYVYNKSIESYKVKLDYLKIDKKIIENNSKLLEFLYIQILTDVIKKKVDNKSTTKIENLYINSINESQKNSVIEKFKNLNKTNKYIKYLNYIQNYETQDK